MAASRKATLAHRGMSEHGYVRTSLKCAVVERERRCLVGSVPQGEVDSLQITDRYVEGWSWRFREMVCGPTDAGSASFSL